MLRRCLLHLRPAMQAVLACLCMGAPPCPPNIRRGLTAVSALQVATTRDRLHKVLCDTIAHVGQHQQAVRTRGSKPQELVSTDLGVWLKTTKPARPAGLWTHQSRLLHVALSAFSPSLLFSSCPSQRPCSHAYPHVCRATRLS